MKEFFVETTAGNIWGCVFGKEKNGIPILVVHGGPGFLTMTETIEDFAEDRPVYFYNQLGSYRSDKAVDKEDYILEHFVKELSEVRKKLGLQEVVLMGFSWGTALICSYMIQEQPTGVKGLILSGPILSADRWGKDQRENIKRMPQEVQTAIEEGERRSDFGEAYQAAMMAYYQKHVCRIEPWPESLNEAFSKLNMDVYMTMWGPSEFTITGKLKDFDVMDKVQTIDVPVLLTCGDMDEASPKTCKDYQLAFDNASLAVIPNSSHLHQVEQPETYKLVVKQFLQDLEKQKGE
ncbi:MAG: proline iminopeptidase-family hydrolase [Thermotogota bacterium]